MQESGNGDTDRIPPWHDRVEVEPKDKKIKFAKTFDQMIKIGRTKSGEAPSLF
jgi:hypothetical protein